MVSVTACHRIGPGSNLRTGKHFSQLIRNEINSNIEIALIDYNFCDFLNFISFDFVEQLTRFKVLRSDSRFAVFID